jgi:hypothetical protein
MTDRYESFVSLFSEMIALKEQSRQIGIDDFEQHNKFRKQFTAVADQFCLLLIREFSPDVSDVEIRKKNLDTMLSPVAENPVDFTNIDEVRGHDTDTLMVNVLKRSISIHRMPYNTIEMVNFYPISGILRPMINEMYNTPENIEKAEAIITLFRAGQETQEAVRVILFGESAVADKLYNKGSV